ncbi:MAG: exosome complex protein Rrp42 [Thermoplasmatales archaeon]
MSKSSDEIVYGLKREYLEKISQQGSRIDGRKFDEIRKFTINTNFVPRAEGSAEVKLGNTRVLVGVKIEQGEPFPDTPNSGILTTNAELLPMASPTFESGPPNEDSIELARVVDRGIRESKMIDLDKLVIEEGKKVWVVFVDIHVLDYDGNLIDASSLGAVASLLTAKVPASKIGQTDYRLPVSHVPVMLTFAKIGSSMVVDPGLEEEEVAVARLSVATDENENIVAMQKGLGGSITEDELFSAVEISIRLGKDIREKLMRL